MEVDPRTAAWQSEYFGKTYYFCSRECKEQFDSDPALYTNRGLLELEE
jgi:P-type Cu+ transporter